MHQGLIVENNAWLLKDTNGDFFAVAEVEMVEYIPLVTTFNVPATPYYCNSIMAWREQLIPIINFASLFDLNNTKDASRVGIFVYQLEANAVLRYIAIPIQESPVHIVVSDTQFCDLPSRFISDRVALALSCFTYHEKSVPILNLNYLVSTKFHNTTPQAAVIRQNSIKKEIGIVK